MTTHLTQQNHESKVQAVADQVRQAKAQGVPYKKVKRAPRHTVPDTHVKESKKPGIDITKFNDVLLVDPERRICQAEPGVTFEELVRATAPHGLIPYTVPEHRQITIGGAVSGCSLESMSYRYGGFHDKCLEYEVVTGDGQVKTLVKGEDDDLMEMVHGSYGTMAVLTKLTFELHPAMPFVHMTYHRFSSFKDYWDFTRQRCQQAQDHFIDGIIHAPNHCVACIGNMVDSVPYSSRYDGAQVFYKSTAEKDEDYMTLDQYFFRYDADLHWLTRTVPILENSLVRRLFGRFFLGSSNVIRLTRLAPFLFKLGKLRPDLVLDVFIPSDNFSKFFDWYEETLDYWPLWIVPYRAPHIYPWVSDEHARKMGDGFLIDCAVYGKTNNDPAVDLSELLEKKTHELGGIKTLITRNHYSRDEFWQVYSRPRYERAKARLDPSNLFGDLYDKMGHYMGKK